MACDGSLALVCGGDGEGETAFDGGGSGGMMLISYHWVYMGIVVGGWDDLLCEDGTSDGDEGGVDLGLAVGGFNGLVFVRHW